MPKIKASVPHELTQDEALRRIKTRTAKIKAQYSGMVSDLSENWDGYIGAFSGSARGFSVSGNLTVDPSVVTVKIALPLVALPLKGKIEARIRSELTTLLAKK
jgi:hypothetical protein